jgi:hypothetical protein
MRRLGTIQARRCADSARSGRADAPTRHDPGVQTGRVGRVSGHW